MTAPLLPAALAFSAGVWLGLETAAPLWLLGAGPLLAGLALAALARHRLTAASAATLALVVLAGWARVALPDPWPVMAGLRPGTARLEGTVSGEPEREGPRTRLPLLLHAVADRDGRRPARGSLAVLLYGPPPEVPVLARVAVTAELRLPRPARNFGVPPARLGAERAGPSFLAVGRSETLEPLPGGTAPWWLRVRAWMHAVVQAHLPPISGALFEGLLVGERRQLPPTLVADFRAAGVFHILAISGFNVALVAGAVVGVLRLLRVPPRASAALALCALGGFAAVVGGQPSVLRATVMAGLVLAGRLIDRESGSWNSLAAALLVLLAWEPHALADPGLQLSFAATAGILHLAPPIRDRLPARWPRPLATAVAVSAGAQLAVSPLMLAYWSQLSPLGIAANLLVVPLAGLATTLGLLAVLLAAVADGAAHGLFQTLWLLLLALRWVVRGAAWLPGAVVHAPGPPPSALAAAAAALAWAPLAAGRAARAAVAGLAALAVGLTAVAALPDGRLRVVMLDVGQGDAILVQSPDGRAILVDTGGGGPGRADRAEHVVLPALRRAGVRRLTALVLTHGDPDHAGGLTSLLEGLPIDAVWFPADAEDADWLRPLRMTDVPRLALARGDRIWVGPLLVRALHPPAPDAAGPPWVSDRNNASLVLRVEWGLAALLLTGDAERPAETAMLDTGLPLGAAILKVGHHGSRHASSAPFVAAVGPRLALVSAGARNPFGHPTPQALARLADGGAAVYRTDLDGAIEITSDGAALWLRRAITPEAVEEVLLRGAP